MIDYLGIDLFYQESQFSENIGETSMDMVNINDPINKCENEDQHKLHHEALKQMDFKQEKLKESILKQINVVFRMA